MKMSKKRKRETMNENYGGRTIKKARKDVGTFPAGTSTTGSLQHSVLSCYFPRVVTLRTFLLSKIPPSGQKRLAKVDLTSDKQIDQDNFLDETLIGILNETNTLVEKTRQQDFVTFTQDPRRSTDGSAGGTPEQQIEEIVDFVVWSLFHKTTAGSLRPKHILCHGYQRTITQKGVDRTPAAVPNIDGLILEQPNENVQTLKQAPWTKILALLGKNSDRVMRNLLLDCGIFLRLSVRKDNYYQLSGVPISNLTPLKDAQNPTESRQNAKKILSVNNVTFARHRILYGKSSLNSKGDVCFGMKHNHVLNRCSDSKNTKQTAHVMKYVFPRQYRLHNVFTSDLDSKSGTQGFKDYTLREIEINGHLRRAAGDSAKAESLPKRLRGGTHDLIRKMQRNNNICPYAQLLRYYTLQYGYVGPNTDTLTSHRSTQSTAKSQVTASMPSNTITTTSSIRAASKASHGSIMQYATVSGQVSAFCQAVLQRLLPRDALGTGPEGEANWDVFLRWIDHFIRMRRNETLNLHVIIQDIKIGAVSWLKPPKLANLKMSASDRDKRWEIFNEFVYYTFDSLLIPLIRTNFYVTESAVHRSRLFYFRHDVWRKISEPSLAQLKLTMFEEVAPLERTVRTLGHSTIRLLPKLNGIRIIANLKKKVMKNFREKTVLSNGINKQLEPVFYVLNYERSQQPLRLGSSIFSSNEIHGRLKEFKSRMGGQKLYFVKLDIKSCFDSIPQEGLVTLAEALLQENRYRIHTHAEIKGGEEKLSRRFPKKVLPVDENVIFSAEVASELALDRKRTVFADTGNLRVQKTLPLLNMLREHITSNTVKIGKKHYRQKNGIPQGSILSSLLCSFFYGAFEAENLSFLDGRSFLVRLIDDFLLVTSEMTAARRFLDVMASGNQEYGIAVQASKSLTNFDACVNGRKIPRLHGTTAFPYIGLTIDTSSLSVAKERASKDSEVRNGLTVQVKQAGRAFRSKVLHSLKIQMLGMVLDTQLNSRIKVLVNLYQCFMEMAMKLCRYVDAMTAKPSAGLVVSVLEESVWLAFNLMRQQSIVRDKLGYKCEVSKLQMEWVASVAVEAVLRKKQSRYGQVLGWVVALKRTAESGIKIDQKMQKVIVEEGSRGFGGYVF
jgi:telomerase reverse transcriptase